MHTVGSRDWRARMWVAITAWLVCSGGAPAGVRAGQKARPPTICTFDTSSAMAFGSYDPMSTSPFDQQGHVSYRCYKDKLGSSSLSGAQASAVDELAARDPLMVTISMSPGQAGNFNRYMSGEDRLYYNIYQDAARLIVWGDGTAGTSVYTEQARPNNQSVMVPVFGRVFGGQDVGGGQYGDTLIVSLNF